MQYAISPNSNCISPNCITQGGRRLPPPLLVSPAASSLRLGATRHPRTAPRCSCGNTLRRMLPPIGRRPQLGETTSRAAHHQTAQLRRRSPSGEHPLRVGSLPLLRRASRAPCSSSSVPPNARREILSRCCKYSSYGAYCKGWDRPST